MENIIKKAIEGGWKPCDLISKWNKCEIDYNKIGREEGVWLKNPEGDGCFQTYTQTVLDPLFWQSLGKACEWGRLHCRNCKQFANPVRKNENDPEYYADCCKRKRLDYGKSYVLIAMDFYKINLTEGWDKAVAYLREIINN